MPTVIMLWAFWWTSLYNNIVRFSEKYGHKTARQTMQIDSVDAELRTSLWNVLDVLVWDQVYYTTGMYSGKFLTPQANPEMTKFVRELWFSYFKQRLDALDSRWQPVLDQIRTHFFSCEWYEVYDFVEFVMRNYPYDNGTDFGRVCNSVLQREQSGYRIVGNSVTPITDNVEIDAIDEALAGESAGPVRKHLDRALQLLSDKQSPDYRNSIKESISAVESLVAVTLGEKGTLGDLIKRLGNDINLHPALCKALISLYGYTSDEDGIRHAMLELPKVEFEDAKFCLVTCSAFVNFVQARIAPARVTKRASV